MKKGDKYKLYIIEEKRNWKKTVCEPLVVILIVVYTMILIFFIVSLAVIPVKTETGNFHLLSIGLIIFSLAGYIALLGDIEKWMKNQKDTIEVRKQIEIEEV